MQCQEAQEGGCIGAEAPSDFDPDVDEPRMPAVEFGVGLAPFASVCGAGAEPDPVTRSMQAAEFVKWLTAGPPLLLQNGQRGTWTTDSSLGPPLVAACPRQSIAQPAGPAPEADVDETKLRRLPQAVVLVEAGRVRATGGGVGARAGAEAAAEEL